MRRITLPTGYLIVDEYQKGQLETLSIGDYGKHKNVKADFLGRTKEINGVANSEVMPVQEKWVVTLSTQYGCMIGCTFCDVPNVRFSGNVSFDDLKRQLYSGLESFPGTGYTDRLNIHFARMGEPIFNKAVFHFSEWLAESKRQIQEETGVRVETIHPVLTTMCPQYKYTAERVRLWASYKNGLFNGQAGLQLSINSTSDAERGAMFNGKCKTLIEVSEIATTLPDPLGRKYCLNIAYASGSRIDGRFLASLFDPSKWMVKITPIHNNSACERNGIKTCGGYSSYAPYREPEESCVDAGFDTLVFIPSQDEEDGLVTCGNAILGGSQLRIGVSDD